MKHINATPKAPTFCAETRLSSAELSFDRAFAVLFGATVMSLSIRVKFAFTISNVLLAMRLQIVYLEVLRATILKDISGHLITTPPAEGSSRGPAVRY
ncbi:hypothetical protein DPMN_065891 [Dreissena polymorpha]|uniref:Uncharacterized protein n=1 Tax=Dreissena polymorpha TaxID=45954 RepID=A0A9D4BSE7_DREPO|nr:hypothetical protein DPMN_065891 [Dreissena polymorpha]